MKYAEGVVLLIALLYDAYSHDQSCMCIKLKLIVSKSEQQCCRASVFTYMFIVLIPKIETAGLVINVDRRLKQTSHNKTLSFLFSEFNNV